MYPGSHQGTFNNPGLPIADLPTPHLPTVSATLKYASGKYGNSANCLCKVGEFFAKAWSAHLAEAACHTVPGE